MEIVNRKAKFNYFVLESIECGIELFGNEVKSIRGGSCDIGDSYAVIRGGEVFVINMFIKQYEEASINASEALRKRKLLLHKKEIRKLSNMVDINRYSLIPLRVYLVRNKVKVLLGVCKGKKNYDKRETIKQRDIERSVKRDLKSY